MNILGYFVHRDDQELNGVTVMVVIDESWDGSDKTLTCYSPIGQHHAIHKDYFAECIPITREQYIAASGYDTPREYL